MVRTKYFNILWYTRFKTKGLYILPTLYCYSHGSNIYITFAFIKFVTEIIVIIK